MRLTLAQLNFTLGAFEQDFTKIGVGSKAFRDRPLAAHLHQVEAAVETDDPRDVADAVTQAIRARYETGPGDMTTLAASAPTEGQR